MTVNGTCVPAAALEKFVSDWQTLKDGAVAGPSLWQKTPGDTDTGVFPEFSNIDGLAGKTTMDEDVSPIKKWVIFQQSPPVILLEGKLNGEAISEPRMVIWMIVS